MDKDYLYEDMNPRSEEVQEIMGRVPHWIVRRGIGLILFVILVLLVGSYFFRYPEKVTAEVRILSTVPSARIAVSEKGRIRSIFVYNSDTVHKGRLLAIVEHDADGVILTDSLVSPMDGVANTTRLYVEGSYAIPGEPIFVITPLRAGKLQAYGELTATEREKVRAGQRVLARRSARYGEGGVEGTVRSVSVIPNAEGKYFFDITFRNCPSDAFPQGGETVTTAEIIVKEKCLLESLLQPIHMFGSP